MSSSNEIDVVFSIPVHESVECVVDMVQNLIYFL